MLQKALFSEVLFKINQSLSKKRFLLNKVNKIVLTCLKELFLIQMREKVTLDAMCRALFVEIVTIRQNWLLRYQAGSWN